MENNKNKRYFSIKTKITASIVSFVLILLAVVFYFSYLNVKKIYQEDLNAHLLNMVSIASLQVSGDEHSLLKVPADEQTDPYKNIVKVLKNIKKNSPDIYYLYTMRENDEGEITFIVDPDDSDPSTVSQIGDVYTDASQFLKDNFNKMDKPMIEPSFYSDQWGTWLSGYAPFYNKEGIREGILGIDISASQIINNERNMMFTYLFYYIISGFLSVLFGLYLSKRLTKSILSLTNLVKESNNDKEMESTPIIIDEVEELSNVLKSKLRDVNSSQKMLIKEMEDKTKTLEKVNKLMVGRELEMIKLKKEIIELNKKIENSNKV